MNHKKRFLTFIIATVVIGLPSWLVYREVHQANLNRSLLAAIKRSDTRQVIALLNPGADPNARDTPSETRSLMKVLIDIFRNRHHSNNDTPTALIVALDQRKGVNEWLPQTPEIVTALLKHGANVNVLRPVPYSDTPLQMVFEARESPGRVDMIAFPSENTGLVKTLLEAGAKTEAVGTSEPSPLILAATAGYGESVRLLIAHGANVNAVVAGSFPTSPLYAAKRMGNKDMVKLLLVHGAKR